MSLLIGYILIWGSLVYGSTVTLMIDDYHVTIEDNVLKSINETSNSSFNLNLSDLGLVRIDWKAFNNLNKLTSLNLDHNHLSSIPELSLLDLENLVSLSIINNTLTHLKNNFWGLKKLNFLYLSNNDQLLLGQNSFLGLDESVHIKAFDEDNINDGTYEIRSNGDFLLLCSNYGIVESLRFVANVENLRYAVKSCTQANLINIQDDELSLKDLGIIGFKKGWLHYHYQIFDSFDLSNNNITHLTITMLNDLPINVTHVHLNGNPIERLENNTISNKNLIHLNFNNCSIREIDKNALADTSLTYLSLSHNRLKNLIFVPSLPSNLTTMILDHNEIFQLEPYQFSKLDKLKILDLGHNHISSLDENSFKGLSDKLLTLKLNGNRIHTLEKRTFIDVPRNWLDLSDNKINKIEDESFNLRNLTILSLDNNSMIRLESDSFMGLPKLEDLSLNFNPFEEPVNDICEKLRKHIDKHARVYIDGYSRWGNPDCS